MATDGTINGEEVLVALDLQPGSSVLSIGIPLPATAAAIVARTGTHLSCVLIDDSDLQSAAAAVRAADTGEQLRLVAGTGYLGATNSIPRFDRILVTQGIAGIPPGWLSQLAPSGVIVAPIAHAGTHPLMRITCSAHVSDTLTGKVIRTGHARPASGLLRPATLSHADTPWPVGDGGVLVGPSTGVVTTADQYEDMRFCLGTADRGITTAVLDTPAFDPTRGTCALVDGVHGAAWIHRDGQITLTGSEELATRLSSLATAWNTHGRLGADGWSATLRPVATGRDGLLLPVEWHRPQPDSRSCQGITP